MAHSLDTFGGWPALLGQLCAGSDLSSDQTEAILSAILAGEMTDAQIAAFIMALRIKGESVDELTGLVRAMQAAATPLRMPDRAIDIVGMGGGPSRQRAALNISTMASFVAAASGAIVCKHGNRKASSTSGSFDLLEAVGVGFELGPEALEACVESVGLGFAFAKLFHPAMRHVGPVRIELGIPTVFNTIGPLSHPARLTRQVIGVADPELAETALAVLAATGSVHSWVVTGAGPLDELTTMGPSDVHELRDGATSSFRVDPAGLGLASPAEGELDGGDAATNAAIMAEVFSGGRRAVGDIVALNAAAGLVVAGVARDLEDGLERALESIANGAAADQVRRLVAATSE